MTRPETQADRGCRFERMESLRRWLATNVAPMAVAEAHNTVKWCRQHRRYSSTKVTWNEASMLDSLRDMPVLVQMLFHAAVSDAAEAIRRAGGPTEKTPPPPVKAIPIPGVGSPGKTTIHDDLAQVIDLNRRRAELQPRGEP